MKILLTIFLVPMILFAMMGAIYIGRDIITAKTFGEALDAMITAWLLFCGAIGLLLFIIFTWGDWPFT